MLFRYNNNLRDMCTKTILLFKASEIPQIATPVRNFDNQLVTELQKFGCLTNA